MKKVPLFSQDRTVFVCEIFTCVGSILCLLIAIFLAYLLYNAWTADPMDYNAHVGGAIAAGYLSWCYLICFAVNTFAFSGTFFHNEDGKPLGGEARWIYVFSAIPFPLICLVVFG